MARDSDRDYERDYADPLELPPEPMGFWGLSERSQRWARDEDAWGTSARVRESRRGRREERPSEGARRSWGRPGYGWGGGRPYGAYEAAPRGYGRGGRSEQRWRERHRGVSSGAVDPASLDEGTGAWGPGQAEPGLWGREPESRRRARPSYDRDLVSRRRDRQAEFRAQGGDIDWNGWGYEWTGGGRGERDWPARASSNEWAQPWREARAGAWDYGRPYRSPRAAGEAVRRRWRRRPDLREGEAWNDVGPERWTHEERPEDREGFAKEWDRGFYFGREDKGGGTPPSVGRHRWTRGSGPGRLGQENEEDYGPPGRGRGSRRR